MHYLQIKTKKKQFQEFLRKDTLLIKDCSLIHYGFSATNGYYNCGVSLLCIVVKHYVR